MPLANYEVTYADGSVRQKQLSNEDAEALAERDGVDSVERSESPRDVVPDQPLPEAEDAEALAHSHEQAAAEEAEDAEQTPEPEVEVEEPEPETPKRRGAARDKRRSRAKDK